MKDLLLEIGTEEMPANIMPSLVNQFKDLAEEKLKEARINQSISHVDFMIGDAEMDIDGILEDGTRIPVFRKGNWAF